MKNHKIPAIYMNRKTVRMLWYIRLHKSCTEEEILKNFGDASGSYPLINLCLTDYLLAIRPDNSYTNFQDGNFVTSCNYRYWLTPKGEEFLDNRFDRLWQWAIPTVISVIALLVSVLK